MSSERSQRLELTADFDHHSREHAADPSESYRRLRDTCPIAWTERHGGYWVLSRYDDVAAVARDHETFSSRHDLDNDGRAFAGITIPPTTPFPLPPVESDPPEHGQFRRILNPHFSPGVVNKLEPVISDITDWCIDRRIEAGTIDFVLDLANPVPAMVTVYMLGIPLDGWHQFAEPLHALVGTPPQSPDRARVLADLAQMNAVIAREVAGQRIRPRKGLIAQLIEAQVDGSFLDDDTIVGVCFLLLGAGVDTTTALISAVLDHLDGDHPSRDRLRNDANFLRLAGEEYVRYFTPNPTEARTVSRQVELNGVCMAANDRVLVSWFAANRDESVFDRPDEVVLDRMPNRHVGFGLGIHRCLGVYLARAMYRVVVPRILNRMPDYVLDRSNIERYPDLGQAHGYTTMPATFTPGPRVAATLPQVGDLVAHPITIPTQEVVR